MHSKKGFTLIELLVVIAIIGILSVMVVTQLGNARGKAVVSTAKSDVTEVGKAIELFKNNDALTVPGQIIANMNATTPVADTLNDGGAGTITGIFTGTTTTSGAFAYGLKLTKSPKGITYTYKTTAGADTRSLLKTCYVFSASDLKFVSGGSASENQAFYVKDGSTGGDSSAPAPTTCD